MSIKNDIDTYILKNTRGVNLPDVRLNLNQYEALCKSLKEIHHTLDIPNTPIIKINHRPDIVGYQQIIYGGCQIVLDPLAVNIEERQA
jgi:hypothetical protein